MEAMDEWTDGEPTPQPMLLVGPGVHRAVVGPPIQPPGEAFGRFGKARYLRALSEMQLRNGDLLEQLEKEERKSSAQFEEIQALKQGALVQHQTAQA